MPGESPPTTAAAPPEARARILIVDDQRNMRTTTALVLRQQGYEVFEAESGEAALSRLLDEPFDVVLTDLKMAPLDGLAVLRGALEVAPSTQVIVMTGYGTVESAVEAMQQGAYDYISKPFKESELLMRVQRALERRRLMVDVGLFSDEFRQRYKLDNLVGRSAPMRELLTKLVRVIQEHEIRRVGDNASIPVDVRVIAATNQDIRQAIADKRFREDLFYRLNVVPLQAPPLRERKEDIPLLAQHFLTRFNQRNASRRTLTQGALQKMAAYDFPGNVRELENVVEQAAALARGDEIDADDVFIETRSSPPLETPPSGVRTLAQEVDQAERKAIESAIERHEGLLEKVARELDVSTTTLWRKMKRLGLRKD